MRSALAFLLLAACATSEIDIPEPPGVGAGDDMAEEPDAGPHNWLLPGTEWRLVELNGAPFAARATAELTTDGRVVGQAPCNRFSATWTGRWPDLEFSAVASTRMACPELEAETAFFAALDAANHAETGSDGLILTGPDGVRLRFVRLE